MVEITSMVLSIVNRLRAFILQMMKKAAKICGLYLLPASVYRISQEPPGRGSSIRLTDLCRSGVGRQRRYESSEYFKIHRDKQTMMSVTPYNWKLVID